MSNIVDLPTKRTWRNNNYVNAFRLVNMWLHLPKTSGVIMIISMLLS